MDILIFGIALLIALSFFSVIGHLLSGFISCVFGTPNTSTREEKKLAEIEKLLAQAEELSAQAKQLKQENQAWQACTQRPLYQVKKKPKLPR